MPQPSSTAAAHMNTRRIWISTFGEPPWLAFRRRVVQTESPESSSGLRLVWTDV